MPLYERVLLLQFCYLLKNDFHIVTPTLTNFQTRRRVFSSFNDPKFYNLYSKSFI